MQKKVCNHIYFFVCQLVKTGRRRRWKSNNPDRVLLLINISFEIQLDRWPADHTFRLKLALQVRKYRRTDNIVRFTLPEEPTSTIETVDIRSVQPTVDGPEICIWAGADSALISRTYRSGWAAVSVRFLNSLGAIAGDSGWNGTGTWR